MSQLSDRVYTRLPVWAQNVGISAYGLAYNRERFGGRFGEYVDGFAARDWCDHAQMTTYVDQQLRGILQRAFEQVPYYRATWRSAGITSADLTSIRVGNLARLPITPKLELKAASEAFVATDVAQRHRLRRYQTSGSTGTPVTCVCTIDAHRGFTAAREVRSFRRAGTSIRKPRSTIGGRMVVPRNQLRPPYYRYNAVEAQVYFSAYHISPANVRDYLEGFHRYRPAVLTGYAYAHYLLARIMREQRLTLEYQPEALVLSSERLTREMKEVIQEAFRARAYEEYGSVENCVLATECEQGNLHVSPDFGILEIVDSDGHPTPAGVEGRVLGTGLLNPAQPLVRYDLGDRAAWSRERCSCGRDQLPTLQHIDGRLEDVIVGPDGRQMVRFHGIFIDLPNVLEGQVVQEAIDRIRVLVVTTPGFEAAQEKMIRERLAERLGPVHVSVERVKAIARTDRGKFKAVISRLSRPAL
jgi:phenylacetate-CoA ligase